MAGILTDLFGQSGDIGSSLENHLVNFLNGGNAIPPAPELQNTGKAEVEKEIEYCFFLKLDDAAAEQLANAVNSAERQMIWEGKLGRSQEVRIRKKLKGDDSFDKCEIQTKYREGDDAIEIENDLAEATFDRLLPVCELVNARIRFELPFPETDLEWEIDAFLIPTEKEAKFCSWVKIELEVDEKTMSDETVISKIPFGYTEIIPGNTKEPEEREIIDRLWQVDYNYMWKEDFVRD